MGKFDRYTKEYWEAHPNEQDAIRSEHWGRAQQGQAVWNKWAAQFAEAIKNKRVKGEPFIYFGADPMLDEEQSFSAQVHNFRFFVFPADVSFKQVNFVERANFGGAQFKQAGFEKAQFKRWAEFTEAQFKQAADFAGARFEQADFYDAQFEQWAGFVGARFEQANFEYAQFEQWAGFAGARFEQANFEYAQFTSQVPDFYYATLQQPPRLSQMDIPDLGSQDKDNVYRYRKLKEMAKQAHDHEQEIRFFAYELKAKRGVEQTSKWNLLASHLYEIFSDFGRSALRPLFYLLCSVVITLFATYSLTPLKPVANTSCELIPAYYEAEGAAMTSPY